MAVNFQAVPGTGLVITPDNSGNMTFSTGLGTGNVAMTVNANASVSFNSVTALNTSGGVITLPAGTGTAAVQGVSTNITQGIQQATTSGSAFLFTGIPAYAKRITIIFNGVTQSGTVNGLVQIGSGSLTITGYVSAALSVQSAAVSSGGSTSTAGFIIWDAYNGLGFTGQVTLLNISGNIWVSSGLLVNGNPSRSATSAGSVTLSGPLDRVNITGVTAPTFTAGSINIMYE